MLSQNIKQARKEALQAVTTAKFTEERDIPRTKKAQFSPDDVIAGRSITRLQKLVRGLTCGVPQGEGRRTYIVYIFSTYIWIFMVCEWSSGALWLTCVHSWFTTVTLSFFNL